MKRLLYVSGLPVVIASLSLVQTSAVGQTTAAGGAAAGGPDQHRAMLNTYCVTCHNTRVKTGGLALDGLDLQAAADSAQIWEKALRKLRGHLMPPPGAPQPPQQEVDSFVAWMENYLDSHPSPELSMHRPSRGGNSGRFIDPLLNTGCTPLLRATMGNDIEVVQALLAKGASPNINAMGLTPFLVAAGVGTGTRGGTGLAAAASAGGAANVVLMNLLLQHGANVNAQVTGTKTYSMRIARAPSSNEGMTALHVAAQAGRTEMVRYLLEKGADTELADSNGRKAIDLVGGGAPPAAGAGGRGGPAGGAVSAASAAEISALLQSGGLQDSPLTRRL